jgi:antirestriction protein
MSCFNEGVGNWKWLEPEQAGDLTSAGLATRAFYNAGAAHDRCIFCDGDEFWCFDVEGVVYPAEMPVPEFLKAAMRASQVQDHEEAEALIAFLRDQRLVGEAQDIETFNEVFMGTWNSAEEYVENFLSDTGVLCEVPEMLRSYIAIDKLTHDMLITDIHTIESEDGMHWVFHNW